MPSRRSSLSWLGCVASGLLLAGCPEEPRATSPDAGPGATARAASDAGISPSGSAVAGDSEPAKVEFERSAMGTKIHLVGYTTARADEAALRAAFDQAYREIERLEKLLSEWRPDSEVSAINRQAGQPVRVGADTFAVVSKGIWAGSISDGTFDITFQTLGDLWKFGDAADKVPRVPSRTEIEKKRKLVDYAKVRIDQTARSVTIAKGTKIGLGGIAKGYIVDRAVEVLRRAKLQDFLVQAGGDLFGAGKKPDGSPWVSGIRDPRGSGESFFAVLELQNHAFSTAGDYARSYIVGGKRYHHIIDPRTGYPATGSRSVTIWAPDAFTADAVDDGVFILGPKRGLELVESLDGVGAVIVDSQNKVWVSKRLEGKVKILKQPTDGP
jgi:FAD:protein FMN transferase